MPRPTVMNKQPYTYYYRVSAKNGKGETQVSSATGFPNGEYVTLSWPNHSKRKLNKLDGYMVNNHLVTRKYGSFKDTLSFKLRVLLARIV